MINLASFAMSLVEANLKEKLLLSNLTLSTTSLTDSPRMSYSGMFVLRWVVVPKALCSDVMS